MQLPAPLRAVVGLVATAADEARHLPDRAVELPMLAVSTALQMSLRLQQRYARLTARGDEVLAGRRVTDEPPAWATFDDPVDASVSDVRWHRPNRADAGARSAATAAAAAGSFLDQAVDSRTSSDSSPQPIDSAKSGEQKRAKSDAKKAPRPSSSPRDAASAKQVSKPRHAPPSRFDAVADDDSDDTTIDGRARADDADQRDSSAAKPSGGQRRAKRGSAASGSPRQRRD